MIRWTAIRASALGAMGSFSSAFGAFAMLCCFGWTRRPFRGDVAALALGPDGTTMVLVASNGQVFRSGDRGVTWNK